jgi:predicted methyltransferase
MPESMKGQADAVLFIRALHNLARFEGQGGFLTAALQDAWDALKPGGILGVVQHRAPDDMTDEWASGEHGYLKQDWLTRRLEQAGFEFVGSSDVNRNGNDQPGPDDVVWRLPPTLMTSREDPDLRARMEAIGESDRMTLKFRKPEQP